MSDLYTLSVWIVWCVYYISIRCYPLFLKQFMYTVWPQRSQFQFIHCLSCDLSCQHRSIHGGFLRSYHEYLPLLWSRPPITNNGGHPAVSRQRQYVLRRGWRYPDAAVVCSGHWAGIHQIQTSSRLTPNRSLELNLDGESELTLWL